MLDSGSVASVRALIRLSGQARHGWGDPAAGTPCGRALHPAPQWCVVVRSRWERRPAPAAALRHAERRNCGSGL